MRIEKQRKYRNIFVWQFFKGNIGVFAVSIMQGIILAGANLMLSWLIQKLIDLIAGTDTQYTLVQLAGICVICIVLSALGIYLAFLAKPRFIAKAIGQYKEFAFQEIYRKGFSAFGKESTSFYISALSNDANIIESDYLSNIFYLIDDVMLLIGAFVLMMWYSPLLTAIAIALALLPVGVSCLVGNRVAEAETKVSEKNESYISTLNDSLSGFSVVKSFKAEAVMCQLVAEKIKEVTVAKTIRKKTAIVVQGMGMVAGIIAQLGVFIVGALLSLNGYDISAGTLLAFVNLMGFVVSPIGSVPQYLTQCKASYALIDKLTDALEDNVRAEGHGEKTKLENGIALQGLFFSYKDERPVLQNVNFTFEANKSYAIVGTSGSGKSTLLNLLMAAHNSYSGAIFYDDSELRQISSKSLYAMVSMVQQNVFIFNASIRDNITMFSDFPRDEVDRAIEMSGLSKLIAERGEDYLCGENGSGLSGGEKQRISIARSLLKKSQVLLVDEATAALDAQTAFQVSNAILNLDGLTRIVVTHSMDENLLKQYDCILTLRNGSITESGSFDELMKGKGHFYSLFTVSQ